MRAQTNNLRSRGIPLMAGLAMLALIFTFLGINAVSFIKASIWPQEAPQATAVLTASTVSDQLCSGLESKARTEHAAFVVYEDICK